MKNPERRCPTMGQPFFESQEDMQMSDNGLIIDTHVHAGTGGAFQLSYDTLLAQMDQNGIGMGLVSPVECCEYGQYTRLLLETQIPQLEANRAMLAKVKGSGGRLFLSFWCKPATEDAFGVYEFIRDNRVFVKGLKLHPFYSNLPLEDKRYAPFLEIAAELTLPVSVHTANEGLSDPHQLLALAKRYPTVPFIMVHMGLCTDNEEAIECLPQAENLFGDTTWVPLDKVRKALGLCGSTKLLFGSDAPVDGDKSYVFYEELLKLYREAPEGVWADLMYRNARALFGV